MRAEDDGEGRVPVWKGAAPERHIPRERAVGDLLHREADSGRGIALALHNRSISLSPPVGRGRTLACWRTAVAGSTSRRSSSIARREMPLMRVFLGVSRT
ncbi:hypothetical protein C5C21_13215 [Rathayibacter tritici]|nr:hypothetical protein C5C21_13215 [Rathayibacter tritici]